jgi:hypothetical protein
VVSPVSRRLSHPLFDDVRQAVLDLLEVRMRFFHQDMNKPKCKCLQTIKINLEKQYGKDAIDFELSQYINFTTGKMTTALPPLRFTYRIKKKDGTLSSKTGKGHVDLFRCPFCGEKL